MRRVGVVETASVPFAKVVCIFEHLIMDDLTALEALLESNRALLASEEAGSDDDSLKQQWASILESWQAVDRLWIDRVRTEVAKGWTSSK